VSDKAHTTAPIPPVSVGPNATVEPVLALVIAELGLKNRFVLLRRMKKLRTAGRTK
jgi:hypothetical protein